MNGLSLVSWIRYRIERLRAWRRAAESIAAAVRDAGLKGRVYVIGSIAEGKATVLSDVDILICIEEPLKVEEGELRKTILLRAIDSYGLPLDYPADLHIMDQEGCRELLERVKSVEIAKL